MQKFLEILVKVKLFEGISQDNIEQLLNCLGARIQTYDKNDFIRMIGDSIDDVGIILSGNVVVIKEDYTGKRAIISHLEPADVFGEVVACAGINTSPVSVMAMSESKIMFIDYRRVITTCTNSCIFHNMLIKNMLKLIANKNLLLNKKIEYLHIKNLRGRLIAYLLDQYYINDRITFEIPLDRAGLADYLNIDRSAMSRELSRMKDEKLIEYWKNSFTINNLEELRNFNIN